MRRLLPLFVLALLSTGCATGLNLPRATFHGMSIRTIQPDPDDERLELELGVDFQIDNPLGVSLAVPEHAFGLSIDGAPATSTGVHKKIDVKPKNKEVVTYGFRLDPVTLGNAIGKDATFEFTADADIDVPGYVLQGLEDVLGGAGGELGEAVDGVVGGALGEALSGIGASDQEGKVKLKFEHAGRIKVPKVPKIKAPSADDKPTVALVGESEFMNLDNVLADLREKGGPVVAILEGVMNQRPDENIRLPAGDILEALGVPSNLTGGAVQALNAFLALQGESSIGNSSSQIEIPVQLPPLDQLIASIDPQAAAKFTAFTDVWGGFANGSLPGLAGLSIPTSLPSGMRIAAPFTLNNPNEFAISAPTFRLGLVDANNQPLLMVGTLPAAEAATTDLSTRRISHQSVAGNTDAAMTLISEINWDQLTGGLLQLATDGPDGTVVPGLRLVGEVTVDPGYGPITVPLNILLPAPAPQ